MASSVNVKNIFLWDALEMEVLQSTLILRLWHLGMWGFSGLEWFCVRGSVRVRRFLLDWG